MDARSMEGEGGAAGFPLAAGAVTPPVRPSRSLLRRLAVLSAASLLVACSLLLGPNQAYLTITNPNDPTAGTFNYTAIIIDSVVQPYTVLAGATLQVPVTANQGHTLSYVFVVHPNSGSSSSTPMGPFVVFVPQGGAVYIGAKYTG